MISHLWFIYFLRKNNNGCFYYFNVCKYLDEYSFSILIWSYEFIAQNYMKSYSSLLYSIENMFWISNLLNALRSKDVNNIIYLECGWIIIVGINIMHKLSYEYMVAKNKTDVSPRNILPCFNALIAFILSVY